MFDSVNLPHRLSDKAFEKAARPLREKLLDAQFDLAQRKNKTLLVLLNGSDGAGKGEILNHIYEWLDDHYLETLSYGAPSQEEASRPPEWRYWRDMPAKGRIGLMLGSWHHRILRARALGELGRNEFAAALAEINRLEEMLTLEGVVLVKIWLHMDDKEARRRLKKVREQGGAQRHATVIEWDAIKTAKARARFRRAALELVEETSTGPAPWALVAAADKNYRNVAVAEVLLQALERAHAESSQAKAVIGAKRPVTESAIAPDKVNLISALDMKRRLNAHVYARELRQLQTRLSELTTGEDFKRRGLVLVFEGNDAAGKGGAIRRVRAALDPRRFRVHGAAAPTEEERARPYLWRFWRNMPRLGDTAIFDRSWYGRVLVERVEGFCSQDDWMRAYAEIDDFERQLHRAGLLVIKCWLAISKEEQIARFDARQALAIKRYKITPEDWRNRDKWIEYEEAACEMIDRTGSHHAPWTLIEANDKKFARVKVLTTIVERLEAAL